MKPHKLIFTTTFLLLGVCLAAARPVDVMAELGIETAKLQLDILLNLKEPKRFFFNATDAMRQLARRVPASSRTIAVRMLGRVVRAYVESDLFKQTWLQDVRTASLYDDSSTAENTAQQRQLSADVDAHTDFRPLLKQRLQDFIMLTELVDFEARLVPVGNKLEFANPFYQHKSSEWKFLYRLGQEPVTEARLFAEQWLAELP
jgi:hypothetical protein